MKIFLIGFMLFVFSATCDFYNALFPDIKATATNTCAPIIGILFGIGACLIAYQTLKEIFNK